MVKMMLGNEACARGLYEAGCRFLSAYPGTPATEIAEYAARYDSMCAEWATNEKVALEAAIGASLAGGRAACAMKHVGLNVCADALFTARYMGVNGGLALIVADDPGIYASQNEQDSRHYARAAKVPMLEPSDPAECAAFSRAALELSERFDTPVLVRSCTRVAHAHAPVCLAEPQEVPLKPYVKDVAKRVCVPANARERHAAVEDATAALAAYSNDCEWNRAEHGSEEIGFVAAGACYLYVKEAFPEASVYKVGLCWPMPVESIRRFSQRVKRLIVVEELDGFMEEILRAEGIAVDGGKDRFSRTGELSPSAILRAMGAPAPTGTAFPEPLPARPAALCAGCPHRGVFAVLKKMGLTALGDVGCYTLGAAAPLRAMDVQICMGASIGMAHGFEKVRPEDASHTIAVIGDSTFLHGGMTALVNAVYNGSDLTTLILDNSTTGMTGLQPHPATGRTLKGESAPEIRLEEICRALGVRRVRIVDPTDMAQIERALREELAAPEPSVILMRRPCALLDGKRRAQPLRVNGLCVNCGACIGLGCPALEREGAQVRVDASLCTGCGLCAQVCPAGALERAVAR